ncbi:MAG: addiction module antidote protein [Pseudomonadota bacterium]
MSTYRTIGEVEEQYLRDHPEEIDDYITVLFDEYAESGDTAALMASLRISSAELPKPQVSAVKVCKRPSPKMAIRNSVA